MSELARQASPAQSQVVDGGPGAVVRIYYRARCMGCDGVDVILTALPCDGVGNLQVEAANRQLVTHRAETGHAIRTTEEQMAPRVLTLVAEPETVDAKVRRHLAHKKRLARRARTASFDSSGEHQEEGIDG